MSEPGLPSKTWSYMRAVLGALAFLVLVPAVCGLTLWFFATYYPEETGKALSPILTPLLESLRDDQEFVSRFTARMDEVERDLKAVEERLEEVMTRSESVSAQVGLVPETGPVQDERGRRLLSALDALTVARVEYAMGNRGVALREVRLAEEILTSVAGIREEIRSTLGRAASELSSNSPAAGDWLSVLWHSVLEEIRSGSS